MCYVIVERYSVCRCLYYQHSVDMCIAYGQAGHDTLEKTILVGYLCPDHDTQSSSATHYQQQEEHQGRYSDSGYGTAGNSNYQTSKRYRR